MSPYNQSIADAKEFVEQLIGHTPEARELLFYIKKLEAQVEDQKKTISDCMWEKYPGQGAH